MGVGAPLRGQPCGFCLQADAQFEHGDHIGHGGEVLLRDAEIANALLGVDKRAYAMAGLNQI